MDIQILTDDTQRASFYFDNAGRDPQEVLREVSDGVDHYFTTHNTDGLPESLCGPVTATLAAINLYALATVPMNVWDAVNRAQDASEFADHAMEHGDAMACEVYGPKNNGDDTVDGAVQRLTEWVLAHLPESDPDAFLASLSFEEVSES